MKNADKKIRPLLLPVVLLVTIFLNAHFVLAQSVFTVDPSSKMVLKGTSNLHDWESNVTEIKGGASIIIGDNKISIEKLSINIPVTAIKSGKSLMDKNTYKALKESDHPHISYKLKGVKNNQNGKLLAVGDLTIAGKTKTVEMPVNYTLQAGSKVQFNGTLSFNMSEFDVEPPTAMMGTVKTGDQVKLDFQAVFASK